MTSPVPKKSPVILLVLALPVLVLVGPSCRHSAPSPSTTWLVVDRDADPRNLGGHPGALFTVNPKTGAVEVFATSSKWKDPIDVVQDTDGSLLVLGYHEGGAGAIFRVSRDGKQVTALELPEGLVDPTHFVRANDGWLWIADKNADPLGLGKKASVATGTLWRLSPDHKKLEIVATGPPLRAPACVRFVGDTTYLLDADAFRTDPITEEGAIFEVRRHPEPLLTHARPKGLVSPLDMWPRKDGTFLVVDANAEPKSTRPTRHRGSVYIVDPKRNITGMFCPDYAGFRDPASGLLLHDAMLVVDASADPNGYGKDPTGLGYGGYGRGAVFRISLDDGSIHVVCASKQFVNPMRVMVLR